MVKLRVNSCRSATSWPPEGSQGWLFPRGLVEFLRGASGPERRTIELSQ